MTQVRTHLIKNQWVLYNIEMKIAITGSEGLIGSSVIENIDLNRFDLTRIDLTDVDASDYDKLADASRGVEALIHFAWKDLVANVRADREDPVNLEMVRNVYSVAAQNGIKRVIMGSSNQAHGYGIVDSDGTIRPTTLPDRPTNIYGHEKLEMEALGREYATKYGLEVVCLRIGNVNASDAPRPTADGKPQRWLSKRDLGQLVVKSLDADKIPGNFEIVYGVSQGSVFSWENSFGYTPEDSAT